MKESTTNSSKSTSQPTRDIRQIFEELEDPDYKQKKLNDKKREERKDWSDIGI
jgi:hypothetical protein